MLTTDNFKKKENLVKKDVKKWLKMENLLKKENLKMGGNGKFAKIFNR